MKILLVGTGRMARAYAAVLTALKQEFQVVGRSEEGAAAFTKETGIPAISGGVTNLPHAAPYEAAIIAVDVEHLASVAEEVLLYGCRSVLLEKPGALYAQDLSKLEKKASALGASIRIAYNRRYLASVARAKELIAEDGGAVSYSFEFNERVGARDVIRKLGTSKSVEKRWFIANSTHVVDLAFYLGGRPRELRGFSGVGPIWDPHPSFFSGAGITVDDVPFAYYANWELPGPWSVEVGTKKRTLVLAPLETLGIRTDRGMETVPLENSLDVEFKPGLYRQVETFLEGKSELPTLAEQIADFEWYERILAPKP